MLRAFGLPRETSLSGEDLANAALSDKKRDGGTLTIVVPRAIGGCTLERISVTELQPILEAGMRHG